MGSPVENTGNSGGFLYSIISLVGCSLPLLFKSTPRYIKETFLLTTLLFLGVVLAIDTKQVDYNNYFIHFEKVPSLIDIFYGASFDKTYGEYGFVIFQSVAKTFGLNYVEFRLALYATYSIVSFLMIRASAFPLLAFLWFFSFFYHDDGNITRTALAGSIATLSLIHYSKGNLANYLLLISLSLSFHLISIVALFPVFFRFLPNRRLTYISILLTSLIIGNFGGAYIISEILNYSSMSEESYMLKKLITYSNSDRGGEGILRLSTLLPFAMMVFAIWKFDLLMKQKNAVVWLSTSTICLSLMFAFADFGLYANRVFRILGMSFIFLFPYQVRLFEKKTYCLYIVGLAFLLSLLVVIKFLNLPFSSALL